MSKHTPGPWKVVENGGRMVGVMKGRSWVVYKSGNDCMMTDELEANANLIAAAPDLLEALELLLLTRTQERHLQGLKPGESPLHDRCHAAIAKAKGES